MKRENRERRVKRSGNITGGDMLVDRRLEDDELGGGLHRKSREIK